MGTLIITETVFIQSKMKLFALLLILRDVDAVSRHPITRLAKLTQFSEEMLDQWFMRLPSQGAWKQKFATNSDRLKRNFERGSGKCGFYDPERIPHGGLTQEEIEKHIHLVEVREEARQSRGRRSVQDAVLLDQIDDFDDLNAFFVSLGGSNDKDRYNRDNGLVAIRQICSGFKNWSKRYLGKCSGQRVNQHQVSVTNKLVEIKTHTCEDYSHGQMG